MFNIRVGWGGWEYIRHPWCPAGGICHEPAPKHAPTGTLGFRPVRIAAGLGSGFRTGRTENHHQYHHQYHRHGWNYRQDTAAHLPAGEDERVPPAHLHDAPLQELQGQLLLQAAGRRGEGGGEAARGHGQELSG